MSDENEQVAIRKGFEAKVNSIMQRLEKVAGDRAAQFPAAYVDSERQAALAEFRTIEGQYRSLAEAARADALATAEAARYNPTDEDQAARTADLLEADMLHRQFPDKTVARNRLVDEARTLLAAGNARAASIRIRAMKMSGASASQLEREVEAALDGQAPHRKAAREMEDATNREYVAHRLAEFSARRRANTLVGDRRGSAVASASEKLAKWVADPEHYAGTAAVAGPES